MGCLQHAISQARSRRQHRQSMHRAQAEADAGDQRLRRRGRQRRLRARRERNIAQWLAKGVTQYQVKWKGYENKDNTWEPIEQLAGCEDMIAEFKEREKTRNAQHEAAAKAKHIEKEAAGEGEQVARARQDGHEAILRGAGLFGWTLEHSLFAAFNTD